MADLLGVLRIKDSNGNWVSVPGLKGDTGEPFKILGIYATAADLEADVTDPSVGDVYLVGTTGAYDIYLYLADGWHNTGRYMPKGDQGDPAPQAEITSAVETWLAANVDPETGYVLDRTLSLENAAAPADLAGNLKSAVGFRVINKEYGTRESAVFTKNEVAPNSTLYYSFSVLPNKSGFLEIFDDNDTRITYFGKGSSTSGDLDYEGSYVLPENYSYAKFSGVSTSIITVHYLKAETNNDILLEKTTKNTTDLNELFSIGDSLLKETDLLEYAAPTADANMYTTIKPAGTVRATGIIDLGSMKGRVYTGRNVYAVYAYNESGEFVARITGPSTAGGVYVFDFTNNPHRYIKIGVLIKWRFDHDLVLGNSIPDSTHRGKLVNELNTEHVFSKRAYLRDGVLGSARYRMGFCQYSNNGVLLLGGEMRYSSGADNNDISIAFRRSLDQGKTFETPTILFERNTDANITYHTKSCGQFLVDRNTGRIYCFCLREDSNVNRLTTNTDKDGYDSSILYKYSDDEGKTWSAEQNIDLRDSNMMILCPSPTHGITMESGTLVVPAWAWFSDGTKKSLIIYSQDHGTTWEKSSAYIPVDSTNECCVAETLTDGELILNCRDENNNYRVVYTTTDLGATWTEHVTSRFSFWSPICQADLLKIKLNGGLGQTMYLYSSPFGSGRKDTKILCSNDLIHWDIFANITMEKTRGYTGLAYFDGILNIVEEYTSEMLTCGTMRLNQASAKGNTLTVPIVANSASARRGQLFYNKALSALQFVDDNGEVKNLTFSV